MFSKQRDGSKDQGVKHRSNHNIRLKKQATGSKTKICRLIRQGNTLLFIKPTSYLFSTYFQDENSSIIQLVSEYNESISQQLTEVETWIFDQGRLIILRKQNTILEQFFEDQGSQILLLKLSTCEY